MAGFRALTRRIGDYARGFAIEDGENIRHEHQELGPAIKRSRLIRDAQAAGGPGLGGSVYIGSVPVTVLHAWLKERGYTLDQYARNEGGTRCPPGMDPVAHVTLDGGVRSEFLRYFLSRDFSKLHTQHVTTKRERSQILMPGGGHGADNELRGAEE